MKNTQKGFVVLLIIAIVAFMTVGGGIYLYNSSQITRPETRSSNINNGEKNNTTDEDSQNTDTTTDPNNSDDGIIIACTMDAMQCPDGSWIGRTGTNCEFACPPLPKVNTETKSQIFLKKMSADYQL
ncbi:MAG TPA: hypothetical protein PJ997_00915 [Candidatus Paceibacterota bacterium]|nr:hypothetical protein [Candidatus Paceibacterota bacterium]HMP18883.1 hypothetical protein [Candidatus Paceibacterota bacterium]